MKRSQLILAGVLALMTLLTAPTASAEDGVRLNTGEGESPQFMN